MTRLRCASGSRRRGFIPRPCGTWPDCIAAISIKPRHPTRPRTRCWPSRRRGSASTSNRLATSPNVSTSIAVIPGAVPHHADFRRKARGRTSRIPGIRICRSMKGNIGNSITSSCRACGSACFTRHMPTTKIRRMSWSVVAAFRWILLLTLAGTAVSLLWIFLVQHRERERERQRSTGAAAAGPGRAPQTGRGTAPPRGGTTPRGNRTQTAGATLRDASGRTPAVIELKSQLYASIGIMAGSSWTYKNLLVRPNDLLRRVSGGGRSLVGSGAHAARGSAYAGDRDRTLAADFAPRYVVIQAIRS